ncbi:MAG: Nif3-like dinuclear metal center hexameric protein [bacterium]
MKLKKITDFLDEKLNIKEIEDYSLNGLQIENSGEVNKAGFAVDASLASFREAAENDVDLLVVHHGLFWSKPVSVTGSMYQRLKILFDADIALYAAHLPLDLHDELGNNARVQKVLGWNVLGNFGEYKGIEIGKKVCFDAPVSLKQLEKEISEKLHCKPLVWNFGKEKIKNVGYVSGGGVDLLEQAIDQGLDLFITGEPKHSFYWTAKEAGISVIFAGHYATETLGVKAVSELLEKEFDLECFFIDLPTGL